MRPLRHVLPVCLALLAGAAHGQAVHRKHLVTSLGGGIGITSLTASDDSLSADITGSGAVRFAFGYALGDRWSLGVHYDRIGSDDLRDGLAYVRFTTYTAEVSYRPWIGKRGTLETSFAFGAGIMALTPEAQRLPLVMRSGVATLGIRYVHMFGPVMGGYLGADHSGSGIGGLTLNDTLLVDDEGGTRTASWNAQRITAGLVVRF